VPCSPGGETEDEETFGGSILAVVGALSVELSRGQHDAALSENGTVRFCDGLRVSPIRRLAGLSEL
jgi:hypothetical protein